MQGIKCYNVGDGCDGCKALSLTMLEVVVVCAKHFSVTMLLVTVVCARH